MKKLFFLAAVAISATMISCGNKAENAEAEAPVEEATEVVEETVAPADSAAAATEEAPAEAAPAEEAPAAE